MPWLHFALWLTLASEVLPAKGCSGNGNTDKFLLPENYSVAEPPARPQAVFLGFSIKQIMDISDVKNVSENKSYSYFLSVRLAYFAFKFPVSL